MRPGSASLKAGFVAAFSILQAAAASAQDNCTPTEEFTTTKPGILLVVGDEYPPYTSFVSGEASGVDIEIIQSFAKDKCLKLEIEVTPAATTIESIVRKRADLAVGGWTGSAERAKILGLTIPIYDGYRALVSKDGLSSAGDLKGKKVGILQGAGAIKPLQDYLDGDGEVRIYQTQPAAYMDVVNGRIDAWLDTYISASQAKKSSPSDMIVEKLEADATPGLEFTQPTKAVFPVQPGNDALVEALNAHITELRASGELKAIIEKHDLPSDSADPGPATW